MDQTIAFLIKDFEHGEYDRICTFLSPDMGYFTLIAKGVEKPASANRAGINYFTKSKIEFFLRLKINVGKLKRAVPINLYKNLLLDENKRVVGLNILKIIDQAKSLTNNYEDLFDLLDTTFKNINDKDNYIGELLKFYKKFLEILNIYFETKKCVLTSSKANIYTLDLSEGGFISKHAYSSKKHILYDKDILKAFKKFIEDDILPIDYEISYKLYVIYKNYLQNIIGLYI